MRAISTMWLLKTLSAGDPSGHDVSSANDIGWKRRKRELDPRCSPTPSDIPATLGVSVRADQVLRSHSRSGLEPFTRYCFFTLKANMFLRSPIAGLLIGKYGADERVFGLGRLSRLRLESGLSRQLSSMNFTIEA